jgi:hypothetical protein
MSWTHVGVAAVVPLGAVRKLNAEAVTGPGSWLQVSIEYASSTMPNSQFIDSLTVVCSDTLLPLGLLETIVQFVHTPAGEQFVPVMLPETVVPATAGRYELCQVIPVAQQFQLASDQPGGPHAWFQPSTGCRMMSPVDAFMSPGKK